MIPTVCLTSIGTATGWISLRVNWHRRRMEFSPPAMRIPGWIQIGIFKWNQAADGENFIQRRLPFCKRTVPITIRIPKIILERVSNNLTSLRHYYVETIIENETILRSVFHYSHYF